MPDRLALQRHVDGTILPVRARAGSRSPGLVGVHAGALKVAVTQAPEHGRANRAIAVLIAKTAGVPQQQVQILSGVKHAQKRFLIRGVSPGQLKDRIAEQLP